jgi:predicted tellurium resistance membrane protein TerC
MEWISSPEAWVALTTLTLLEIVLGVDNIIFISILVGRLPESQRQRARLLGLGFAMGTRILLLLLLTWIMRLQATLFTVLNVDISGRDLILIGGGLFLLAKATLEIHEGLEGGGEDGHVVKHASFISIIIQIGLIDIVFSLDSVITAVGAAVRAAGRAGRARGSEDRPIFLRIRSNPAVHGYLNDRRSGR